MLVIPAIDIKGGKCVRLKQGRMDEVTVYYENPIDAARRWEDGGAKLIHIVDLNAAIEGKPINTDVIKKISETIKTSIQIGGGIRDFAGAEEYLKLKNVRRIVIGTAASGNMDFIKLLTEKYPGRIAVGIDAKDGMVAIKGWVEVTDIQATKLLEKLKDMDISSVIYTDISRDGMLKGPNIEAIKKILESTKIPVIASGGISSIKDVEELKKTGAYGVIIGKALYSGDINLKEAIEASK